LPTISGAGRILNISCSGAWLETSVSLRLCSLLYLESLDDRAPPGARASASVVRRTAHGVGLEWCEKDGLFQRCHLDALPAIAAAAPATSHLMRARTHAA
jgi:hypothetical protein